MRFKIVVKSVYAHTWEVCAHATSPYYSHFTRSQMFNAPCSHLMLFCHRFMRVASISSKNRTHKNRITRARQRSKIKILLTL